MLSPCNPKLLIFNAGVMIPIDPYLATFDDTGGVLKLATVPTVPTVPGGLSFGLLC